MLIGRDFLGGFRLDRVLRLRNIPIGVSGTAEESALMTSLVMERGGVRMTFVVM
jgi:hypothetical protein